MTLLSKSSKGSSSPPTYSKLSATGLNEFATGLGNGNCPTGQAAGVYSAMNGSSMGLTESVFNPLAHQPNGTNHPVTNNSSTRNQANYSTTSNNKNSNSGHTNKTKKYHLIKSNEFISNTTPNIKDDKSKQEIAAKLVSEVYLTRLLATKVS